jgi:hypothetical protein
LRPNAQAAQAQRRDEDPVYCFLSAALKPEQNVPLVLGWWAVRRNGPSPDSENKVAPERDFPSRGQATRGPTTA